MTEPAAPALPAMVLAAGYGKRLRPLTDHLPKAMLPIMGRPLLSIVLENLRRAGVTGAVVNTHHLSGPIEAWVRSRTGGLPVDLIHEPEILDTGGALWNARGRLGQGDRFLLHNGDVLCGLDLRGLGKAHAESGAVATLLLTDWPQVNSVRTTGDGAILDIGVPAGTKPDGGVHDLTYTGIAMFERRFLDTLPPGPSSVVDALRRAMTEHPGSVRGFAPDRFYWNDLGTVGRYLQAHADVLGSGPVRLPGLPAHHGPLFMMEPGPEGERAHGGGFLAVGTEARLEPGCSLEDCVVLDGGEVPSDERYRRTVFGRGWMASEEENRTSRLIRAAAPLRRGAAGAERIEGHGSDREFWRVKEGELSAVLMKAPGDDPEFERFVALGRFLWEEDLGAPRILDVSHEDRTVLMEDLGSRSLFDEAVAGAATLETLYRTAIDRLVDLQVRGTRLVEAGRSPEAGDRALDYDTLRWETDYFRRRFLDGLMGVETEDTEPLVPEFHHLAVTVSEQPVVLIHRDFQSQNLMVQSEAIRLVDFQGMRRGPLLYDMMSLVRDAYVDLGPSLRNQLLDHYRNALSTRGGGAFSREEILRMAVAAGLQRNMQALGAFGFLSEVKGKRLFRRYVPLGIRHVREGLAESSRLGASMPALEKLMAGLPRFRP